MVLNSNYDPSKCLTPPPSLSISPSVCELQSPKVEISSTNESIEKSVPKFLLVTEKSDNIKIIDKSMLKSLSVSKLQITEKSEAAERNMSRFTLKKGMEGELLMEQKKHLHMYGIFENELGGSSIYYELYGRGERKVLFFFIIFLHFQKVIFLVGMDDSMDDFRRVFLYLLKNPIYQILIFEHRGVSFSKYHDGKITFVNFLILLRDL
jgi:hypothetical protein